jgi:replicative DNA helicase
MPDSDDRPPQFDVEPPPPDDGMPPYDSEPPYDAAAEAGAVAVDGFMLPADVPPDDAMPPDPRAATVRALMDAAQSDVPRKAGSRPRRSEPNAGAGAPPPHDIAPPADLVAERAVLSACMNDGYAVALAQAHVRPEDFYDRRHAQVFGAIAQLALDSRDPDPVAVHEVLDRQGFADRVGLPYILTLAQHPGAPLAVEHYARRVAKLAAVHRIARTAQRLAVEAFRPGIDPDEYIDGAAGELRLALDSGVQGGAVRVGEVAQLVFHRALEARQRGGEITGISTGFRDIDRCFLGLHPTDLIVLAARPGMGKTAFALNLALHVALGASRKAHDAGHGAGAERAAVMVFSLEMGREQLTQRVISLRSGVPLTNLRKGDLSPEDEIQVRNTVSELSALHLFIDDTPSLSAVDVRARAKREAQRPHGLDLVIVDYLQLMRGSGVRTRSSREEEVSENSRALKALAKELGCTVIALSQLNRSVEREKDHRPKLADLRESGAIEQDADIVAFIYREGYYTKRPEQENEATLIVAKHRAGEIKDIPLHFEPRLTKFASVAHIDDRYAGY